MATLSDEEKLLHAVLLSFEVIPKPDYEKVKDYLGLPTIGAAQVRWSRFTTKLKKAKDDMVKSGALTIGKATATNATPTKKRAHDEVDGSEGEYIEDTPDKKVDVKDKGAKEGKSRGRKKQKLIIKEENAENENGGEEAQEEA